MKYLVILDDGHGNDTSGKRTPFFEDGTFMIENDFNKEVVMLIYNNLLNIPDIDVAFTAPEKYDVPLNTRIRRANQFWRDHQNYFGEENSKCILISVHANAYGTGGSFNSGKGVETYCCSSPPEERVLAETIHKHLKGGTTQFDRGVKQICFAILKGNMTSCLVECAFMTNYNEARLLLKDSFRKECAIEITAGIIEYFNLAETQIV
jgi:N-acetylmuramoyl-L-alanine amidase